MVKIMDLRRNEYLILLLVLLGHVVGGNVVFNVEHKFGGRGRSVLKELKAHDVRRHGRMLAAADFQLGGNGRPMGIPLYYTKLSIGTPSKDYHVQVDTGSDLFWVNCAGCSNCSTKSYYGIEMTQYNLHASTSGKSITCDQDVCAAMYEEEISECKVGKPCEFSVDYADNTTIEGHYVKDSINLDLVSGDYKTSSLQGNIAFGCASKQYGELGTASSEFDGLIGFGSANMSVISQLAASGTVKRSFAHCLNGANGGGIFAIGQVVEPKVNSVPLLANTSHYFIALEDIEVGGEVLNILTSTSESKSSKPAMIDSGTTFVYLPSKGYHALMNKLIEKQPAMKTRHRHEIHDCFTYRGNVDEGFPAVTFKFMGNLSLTAYPHDYLFEFNDNEWCVCWQEEKWLKKDEDYIYLIGDTLLSNKLVLYDLEKGTIGWTQYDCSSNIKVKDETSGNVYTMGAHNLSSASTTSFTFFFSLISFLCYLLLK